MQLLPLPPSSHREVQAFPWTLEPQHSQALTEPRLARPHGATGQTAAGLCRVASPSLAFLQHKTGMTVSAACRGWQAQRNDAFPGAIGPEPGLSEWTMWDPSSCEQGTLPLSARPQRVSLVLLLFLLLLLGPTWHAAAQRCPQTCVCDNSRRHVVCRHQNLTEVPQAIPEVSRARWGVGGGTAGGDWAGIGGSATAWLGGDLGK